MNRPRPTQPKGGSGLMSSMSGGSEVRSLAATTEGEDSDDSAYNSEELEEILSIDEWLKDLDHNEIEHSAQVEHKKRQRREWFPAKRMLSVRLPLAQKGAKNSALVSPKYESARPSIPDRKNEEEENEKEERDESGRLRPTHAARRPRSLPPLRSSGEAPPDLEPPTKALGSLLAPAPVPTTTTTTTTTTATSSSSGAAGGTAAAPVPPINLGTAHEPDTDHDDDDDDDDEGDNFGSGQHPGPHCTRKRRSSFTAFLSPRRRRRAQAQALVPEDDPDAGRRPSAPPTQRQQKQEPPGHQHNHQQEQQQEQQESLWRRSISLLGWRSPRGREESLAASNSAPAGRASPRLDTDEARRRRRDGAAAGLPRTDSSSSSHDEGDGGHDDRERGPKNVEHDEDDERGFWRRNSRWLSGLVSPPRGRRQQNVPTSPRAAPPAAAGGPQQQQRNQNEHRLRRASKEAPQEEGKPDSASIYLRMQLDFEARTASRSSRSPRSRQLGDDAWQDMGLHNPHHQAGDPSPLSAPPAYGGRQRGSSTVLYSPRLGAIQEGGDDDDDGSAAAPVDDASTDDKAGEEGPVVPADSDVSPRAAPPDRERGRRRAPTLSTPPPARKRKQPKTTKTEAATTTKSKKPPKAASKAARRATVELGSVPNVEVRAWEDDDHQDDEAAWGREENNNNMTEGHPTRWKRRVRSFTRLFSRRTSDARADD